MRNDVLLDANYDLIDEGLEWAEGESDEQHVALMLMIDKGELREFPWAGFGATRRLRQRESENKFLRELSIELENDGYSNARINTGESLGDLKIEIPS